MYDFLKVSFLLNQRGVMNLKIVLKMLLKAII